MLSSDPILHVLHSFMNFVFPCYSLPLAIWAQAASEFESRDPEQFGCSRYCDGVIVSCWNWEASMMAEVGRGTELHV